MTGVLTNLLWGCSLALYSLGHIKVNYLESFVWDSNTQNHLTVCKQMTNTELDRNTW